MREKETLIYYPAEKKAFRMLSENPLVLPFFNIFLRVLKEDFGLAELGYTFRSYQKDKDALLSSWAPPKKLSNILGEILLKFQDNRIISVEIKNIKGAILTKIFLEDYVFRGRFSLPMQIVILQTLPSYSSEERIFFENAQFDVSLPEEVLSFKIPEGVEVKEIKW